MSKKEDKKNKKKRRLIQVDSHENHESSWETGIWVNKKNALNLLVFTIISMLLMVISYSLFVFLAGGALIFFLYELRKYEKKQRGDPEDSFMWGTHRQYLGFGETDGFSSGFGEVFETELYFDYVLAFFMPLIIILKFCFHQDSKELLNRFVKFGGKYYFIANGKQGTEVHEIATNSHLTYFMDLFRVADNNDHQAQIIKEAMEIEGDIPDGIDDQQTIHGMLFNLVQGIFINNSPLPRDDKSLEIAREFDDHGFTDIGMATSYFEKIFERKLTSKEKSTIQQLMESKSESTLDLDTFPIREKDPQTHGRKEGDQYFD